MKNNLKHKKYIFFLSDDTYQVHAISAGTTNANQILCLQHFKVQRGDYKYQP